MFILTDEGCLYLCSVRDLYPRRTAGWAIGKNIDRYLAITALKNTVDSRKPDPELISHTNRRCQFASNDCINTAIATGDTQSI